MTAWIQDLHQQHLSLNHQALVDVLSSHQNLLIVQDLDGVCMGLVKDPLTRVLDLGYVKATKAFDTHFYVLTNGEHIGSRGVNGIVERSLPSPGLATSDGLYLPGLAAGGVQWQTRYGDLSHPGVSAEILEFLAAIPAHMEQCIADFFTHYPDALSSNTLQQCLKTAILDNAVSPTANLNIFHEHLGDRPEIYQALQKAIAQLTQDLLHSAKQQGLDDTFFIHYAPNLGLDADGNELILMAAGNDSGTTDFQFMLKGARKEVGLLFLLNQYYASHWDHFPLGENFHGLNHPSDPQFLLQVLHEYFEPDKMPLIVGVGDTVTSQGEERNGTLRFFRGGSDRGFLHLIQSIGESFEIPNLTVYVDSSGGEVKNRKPLQIESVAGELTVTAGPTDDRDREDPLRLNIAIPGGHQAYISLFKTAAARRKS